MNLPEWKTPPEQREEFTAFIISELDVMADEAFRKAAHKIFDVSPADMTPESRVAFITYMTSNNFPPYLVERTSHWFGMDLAEIGDQIERLRALGFEVSGPRKRGGVTSTERSAYLNAQDDVPRIRTIFHRHWGKRNRHHLPLAEEIAALRWKLTHAETEKLIRSFRRQGAQES